MKSGASKIVCLSLLLFLLAASAIAGAPDERLRVVVLEFANRTGDESFDTPCATVSDNLLLTLRLLGQYQIERPDSLPANADEKALLEWCESNFVDYALYGSVSRGKDDTQNYELSVFSREKKRTTIRKSFSGSSVFDAFAASDELTVAVLDSLTGKHISFGSVAFRNVGKQGSYEAVLDGVGLADDSPSIDRVVSGSHSVVVYEKQNGIRTKVLESDIAVAEGAATEVRFELKGVTPPGTLSVSSKSDGDLFVDGGIVGKVIAPSAAFPNIPEGNHSVEIRYRDGKSEFADVAIVGGKTNELSFFRVVEAAAELRSFGKAQYSWLLIGPSTVSFEGKTYENQPILGFGNPGFVDFAKDAKLALVNDPAFQALSDSYSARLTVDKAVFCAGILGMVGSFIFTTTSVPQVIESRSAARPIAGGIAFAGSAVLAVLSNLDFSFAHMPGKMIKYINARAAK